MVRVRVMVQSPGVFHFLPGSLCPAAAVKSSIAVVALVPFSDACPNRRLTMPTTITEGYVRD